MKKLIIVALVALLAGCSTPKPKYVESTMPRLTPEQERAAVVQAGEMERRYWSRPAWCHQYGQSLPPGYLNDEPACEWQTPPGKAPPFPL